MNFLWSIEILLLKSRVYFDWIKPSLYSQEWNWSLAEGQDGSVSMGVMIRPVTSKQDCSL